jgi:hypothetical protein
VAAAGALSLDELKGCAEEPEGVEALDRLCSRPLNPPVDIVQSGLLLPLLRLLLLLPVLARDTRLFIKPPQVRITLLDAAAARSIIVAELGTAVMISFSFATPSTLAITAPPERHIQSRCRCRTFRGVVCTRFDLDLTTTTLPRGHAIRPAGRDVDCFRE